MTGARTRSDGPLWEHRRGGPWMIWHRPGAKPYALVIIYGLMLYTVLYAGLSDEADDIGRWFAIPFVLWPSVYFGLLSRKRIVVDPPLIRLGSKVHALADVRVCRRVTDPDEIAVLVQRSAREGNQDLANPRTVLDRAVLVSTGDAMSVLSPPDPDAFVACVLDAQRRGDGVWRRGERRPSPTTPPDPDLLDGTDVVLPDGTRIGVDQLERAVALRSPEALRAYGSSSRLALANWPGWLRYLVVFWNPAVATAADHSSMAGGFGTHRVGTGEPQAVRLDLSNPEPLGGDVVMRVIVGVEDADAALAAIAGAAEEAPALSSDRLPGGREESRASWPAADEAVDRAAQTPPGAPAELPAPLDPPRGPSRDRWVPDGWDEPLPPPPPRPAPVQDAEAPGATVPRGVRILGLVLGGLASLFLVFLMASAQDDPSTALGAAGLLGVLTWPWWRPLVGGPRVLSGLLPVRYALRSGAWVVGLLVGAVVCTGVIATTVGADVRDNHPASAIAVVESSGSCGRGGCSTLVAEIDGRTVETRVSRRYEVGARVPVLYDPEDPRRLVVEDLAEGFGRGFAAVVVVAVVAALAFTRPRRPRVLTDPEAATVA